MRIRRNVGFCSSGLGFSLKSEGGTFLVFCKWWLVPLVTLVTRSSYGGRLLLKRARCNPCSVEKEGGEGVRAWMDHTPLKSC